ncbi:MAG: hypothetical protein ABIO70_09925 [Pseudomonadota bacterium]
MNRFWRTVSITLGTLLAASCQPRTKDGIDTGDTGDTGGSDAQAVTATVSPEGSPLPATERPVPAKKPAAR